MIRVTRWWPPSYGRCLSPRNATDFWCGITFRWLGRGPGWGRFVVALDSVEIARETVNPRVAHDWKDVTVDLGAPPRTGVLSIAIRFTEKDGRDLVAAGHDARGLGSGPDDQTAHGHRRGVILISMDTLWRDHVGAYGCAKPTTPSLDALGANGILAEDAVSVSLWTLPSHLSMLTAVLPGAHAGTT